MSWICSGVRDATSAANASAETLAGSWPLGGSKEVGREASVADGAV